MPWSAINRLHGRVDETLAMVSTSEMGVLITTADGLGKTIIVTAGLGLGTATLVARFALPSHRGQRGDFSSIRKRGPPGYLGPSSFTNPGASPPRTQTVVSCGCLPRTGAISPRKPPRSILTLKRTALRGEPPAENEASPAEVITSFTRRGFGVATTIDTLVDPALGTIFFNKTHTIPLPRWSSPYHRHPDIGPSPARSTLRLKPPLGAETLGPAGLRDRSEAGTVHSG